MRRMDAWGLNTVANWSDERLWEAKRKPYVIPLASWLTGVELPRPPRRVLPRPSRRKPTSGRAGSARRDRDDPWLLGYFLANEPPFPQKELQTVELIRSGPQTATRAALEKWLAAVGHRGAAEGVRRRRLRPLRRDHERGGEAARPEPSRPGDAERWAADRRRDPRRARLRRLQRQHLRLRGARRAGAADRRAHGQADPDRRVPLRHAGPRAGGEPRPGARPGGARTGLPLLRGERVRDARARGDALLPVGGPAERPGASTARTTTSASWT